jgi:hypothetical protein
MTHHARISAASLASNLRGGEAESQPVEPDVRNLGWLIGERMHINADSSRIREAFIGPAGGLICGVTLAERPPGGAYAEYQQIGPGDDGRFGLTVTHARTGGRTFMPLKVIEAARVTFQSEDGLISITYVARPGGGVASRVVIRGAGEPKTTDYDFQVLPR